MDYFKELMDILGAKEMPVLGSDFETGSRNYELKEDGFVINIFESIDDSPSVLSILVSKEHKGKWIKSKYMIQKQLIEDPIFFDMVKQTIELCKGKINKLIEDQCQDNQ